MGEACSGMLANLYLFSFELNFMRRLVAAHKDNVIQRFLYTRRYIDDIGSWNNGQFGKRRYLETAEGGFGIYPQQFLQLNEERRPAHGKGGRFLDTFIHCDDKTCTYRVNAITERQDTRPRRKPKYPTNDTLLADKSKYGIILGEGTRFRRLCMDWSTFTEQCADMVDAMHQHGYDMAKVKRKLRVIAQLARQNYDKRAGATYQATLRKLRKKITARRAA